MKISINKSTERETGFRRFTGSHARVIYIGLGRAYVVISRAYKAEEV
jgi:hypothetical protein